MKSTGLRRKTVLLLLSSVIAFPWAAFAGPRLGIARAEAAISASRFLEDLLDRAWALLTGVHDKEGCPLDPNGGCTPRPAPRNATGCHLDPDGLCAPQPTIQTDEGCHLDPNGGCRS